MKTELNDMEDDGDDNALQRWAKQIAQRVGSRVANKQQKRSDDRRKNRQVMWQL